MDRQIFQEYFEEVKSKFRRGTEYTSRTGFENFLNGIKPSSSIEIIQESKKEEGEIGKPDFRIETNGLIVGYIETKPIGTDLNEIINPKKETRESNQLKDYLRFSANLILTNYSEFVLFKNGELAERRFLFYLRDKNLKDNNIQNIYRLFHSFFVTPPKYISKPKKLSELLAERTKRFREILNEFLDSDEQQDFKSRLVGDNGLFQLFKDTLIEDLKKDEFVDAYVQTITYGLFLAKLNSDVPINKQSAFIFVPKSMGAIKELFKTIEVQDIPNNISWIIDQIVDIVNHIDMREFKKRLSFSKIYYDKDPYVYFYENFLGSYDKKKKKRKGIYYTPLPVVRFIVNSIDKLLRRDFKIDGFKGAKLTVLDFATGTGTFLLEAFEKAIQETEPGLREILIREHLLKYFYGFEYLIAPYTVAHLKLSQFLKDNGYVLEEKERLKVYLTDTLDNTRHKEWALFPIISKEGKEANKVKLEEPILVVMGNPPYSNYSRNKKPWIKNLIKTYKEGLDERKINIDDDYIKFLRFAQWKIEKKGHGIVGVITNNSYIDGITHPIMRKKLLETFDRIYILNLHGNTNKEEPDENVFDIKSAGISIAIFEKLSESLKKGEVYYYSSLEHKIMSRDEKFEFLLKNDVITLHWENFAPKKPDYWFVKKDLEFEENYKKGWSIIDIFGDYNSGIQTGKDHLVVDFNKENLIQRIKEVLKSDNEEEIRRKYNLVDTSGWSLARFKRATFDESKIREIHFRPFDFRWIFYDNFGLKRDRRKTLKHFLEYKNIGLIAVRQFAENKIFNHVFITDKIVDMRITTSNRGTGFVFPLYLYFLKKSDNQLKLLGKKQMVEFIKPYKGGYTKANFTDNFVGYIIKKYPFVPKPEEILGYIYSILHSSKYRNKFNVFLKTSFPRIQFTDDFRKFKKLSKIGQKLIECHLLKNIIVDPKMGRFFGEGNSLIDKVEYDEKSERLYINSNQCFVNIPKAIWELEIGGYRILENWLKKRKGRKLSYDDIKHLKKVMVSLHKTTEIMRKIDGILSNI